jgi:hypothetical protein
VNRLSACLLLVLSAVAFAQTPQIKSGATVYIEPMDGYETYLAAALVKKHVPVIVVADESKADYTITSKVIRTKPSQPAVVVNNSNVTNGTNDAWSQGWARGSSRAAAVATSASISVIDARTSQIVFGYSVGKVGKHETQSTSEACAKHLKEFIEKSNK